MTTQYKCPNFEFFWFVFYNVQPEYADLRGKSLFWVWIREHTDQVVIRLNPVLNLDLSHVANIQCDFTDLEPVCMMLEYLPGGDLLSFLIKSRKYRSGTNEKYTAEGSFLSSDNLVSFAHQICCGMEHLANHNVSSYGRQINFRLGLEL